MSLIVLKSQGKNGEGLEAAFDPKGLRLAHLKKGGIDIAHSIAESGYSGVIGPQFGSGAFLQTKKAMQAVWDYEGSEERIEAFLQYERSGEEQGFKMIGQMEWRDGSFVSTHSIVSDTDSLIGPGYCFHLPNGEGLLKGRVRKCGYQDGIAEEVVKEAGKEVEIDLSKPCTLAVLPYLSPIEGELELETKTYKLKIGYRSNCEELSCLIDRPEEGEWICISPISAKNPWKSNLTVSHVTTRLNFLDNSIS